MNESEQLQTQRQSYLENMILIDKFIEDSMRRHELEDENAQMHRQISYVSGS